MSCSYEGCDFECYEDNDKCIFHHDKQDWLTPKTKVWKSDSEEKIKEFWNEIRNWKDELEGNFKGFIFPKFQEYQCEFIRIDSGKHIV